MEDLTANKLIKLLQALPEDQKELPILTSDNDGYWYDLAGVIRVKQIEDGRETDNPEADLCLTIS